MRERFTTQLAFGATERKFDVEELAAREGLLPADFTRRAVLSDPRRRKQETANAAA